MISLASWLSVRGLAPLLIPPAYIAVVSSAERRWGQTWSGRLTAVPTQTSAVILLVALTESPGLAAEVSAGAILGVMSLSAFSVGYGLASRRASWPVSISVALVAFLAVGLLLAYVHRAPATDAVAALGAVTVAILLLRRIETPSGPGRRRSIGLAVRMALATVLVVSVVASVPFLGPLGAGTLGVFPIITAPMTVLNHQESGPDASRRYLEGLEWGLLGGVLFFLTLASLLGPWGTAGAFAVAAPVLVLALIASFLVSGRRNRTGP